LIAVKRAFRRDQESLKCGLPMTKASQRACQLARSGAKNMTTDTLTATAPQAPADASGAPPALATAQAADAWEGCKRSLSALLKEEHRDADWLARLADGAARMRRLAARDPDLALYLLMQTAASDIDRYRASHVLLCAVACELAAHWFEWPAGEIDTLVHAALTMNLSMARTQDALARQTGPLSRAQRNEIDEHAGRSAELLAEAGVEDALWLDVVRLHHASAPPPGMDPHAPAARLAELLHRIDVYTAKLSRRASRDPVSAAIAARDACLDRQGAPDAIGVTLLRVIGLYPPGSFVLLRSGEIGIVVRRGLKAHAPVVAVLRRADGGLCVPPALRDTASSPKLAVVRGVRPADVNVRLNHEKVLGCLQAPHSFT